MKPGDHDPSGQASGQAPDDVLLDAAQAGDTAALEALLLRHQDRVYRFGMKLCRNPDDAQDVLQDTLLTMARSIRDFQGRSSLATWLYTVARSFCIKKRRKSKFAPAHEDSLELAAGGSDIQDPGRPPDETLAGKEVEAALERAIRSLEPEQREVLLLRDVEGLSAAEVAEVLDLSVAATKSRLHRARLRVRELVAPMLGIDGPASPDSPASPGPIGTPGGGCPDVLAMYSRHVEDEISADLCARMEQHVAGCARCRGACDSLKRTLSLCQASRSSSKVPDAVQDSVRAALRQALASHSQGGMSAKCS